MILTPPESLTLSHFLSEVAHRLEVGSGIIYDLSIAGQRCTNIYRKFSCDVCENMDKPLCKAIKLFIKLEREYYLLTILELIREIVRRKEEFPEWAKEQRKPQIKDQMKLF
jgi:hypothetical protein